MDEREELRRLRRLRDLEQRDADARFAAMQQGMEQRRQEANQSSRSDAFVRGVGDTFSFGMADEAAGAMAGLGTRAANVFRGAEDRQNPNEVATEVRERARAQNQRARENHPVTNLAGSIVGVGSQAVGGGLALSAKAPQVARSIGLFGRSRPMVAGGLYGASEGGVHGFGSDEGGVGDRLDGARDGALMGGAFGVVAPGAGHALTRTGRNVARVGDEVADVVRARNVQVPELEELANLRRQAYAAVDESGATYNRLGLAGLTRRMQQDASSMRLNSQLTPKAAAVMDEMQSLPARDLSLSELDDVRKYVRNNLGSANDASERAFGQMIVRHIDDFIENVSPSAPGRNAAESSALIRGARRASRREHAANALDRAMEEARSRAARTGTGGNTDNTVRQELWKLIKPGSRQRSLFDDDQIQMIQRVVEGDDVSNLLRSVGGLSPDRGFLPAAAGIGLTAGLGPAGALLPAAGYAARHLGGARQGAQVNRIVRSVRGS